jgi:hypothetical protein
MFFLREKEDDIKTPFLQEGPDVVGIFSRHVLNIISFLDHENIVHLDIGWLLGSHQTLLFRRKTPHVRL